VDEVTRESAARRRDLALAAGRADAALDRSEERRRVAAATLDVAATAHEAARNRLLGAERAVREGSEASAAARLHAEECARQVDELEATTAALEADAQREVEEAGAELARAREALDAARADLAGAEELARASAEPAPPPDLRDVEIYVLSRVADSRTVADLGSVPLILVDPFAALGAEARPVLDLVGRMASLVQFVYLSEDPAVVEWARELGPDRASVLVFNPADAAG